MWQFSRTAREINDPPANIIFIEKQKTETAEFVKSVLTKTLIRCTILFVADKATKCVGSSAG